MRVSFTAVLLLSSVSVGAAAQEYEIDPAHTGVHFSVRHLMVSNVRGEFGTVRGKVFYDESDPSRSTVEAVVEVPTINTREKKRDDHLRGPDFFDAAKHPAMTFKSKKVIPVGGGRLKAVGDLTIRGTTKEVTLNIEGPTAEITDPWGILRRGASATTTLDRRDFGLTWNKALETGGVVVGDQVQVTLDVELKRAGKSS